MKRLLALFLCFAAWALTGQNPALVKSAGGVVPAKSGNGPAPSAGAGFRPVTRAVVVGISDYQSPQIKDLQFADKDAEAFAAWLKGAAGGNVPAENIQLLTNAKATNGQIMTQLYWLVEESQEGDIAIFYFSGHGDVEAKIRGQAGFLLAHDSPHTNYVGSAVNLRDVQAFVSTLSIDKKVRVVLIADACHAGKLAGTDINGSSATAQALSQQFAYEVKIMSCQPNEFSLEGTQWGGGRGLFSWYLVDGLTGLADQNGDGTVNLFEIGRYLEDKVSSVAAPHQQLPMTRGERQTAVSQVNAAALAALIAQKKEQKPELLPSEPRGIADAFFNPRDSVAERKLYENFLAALDSGNLLQPKGSAAVDYYNQLVEKRALQPLHGLMRRNLAAALIDEVQQALNALLDNDPYEANNWKYNPAKYREYPGYLQKAMELLGEKHLMYRSLMAKKLYFEGYNLATNLLDFGKKPAIRDSIAAIAKARYLESLQIEPGAAYVYYAVGSLYYKNVPIRTDSLLVWMQKAVDRSPSWLLPYLDAADELNTSVDDLSGAEAWILKAKTRNPTSYMVLFRLACLHQWQNRPEEANAICRQLIEQRPELANAWEVMSQTQYWIQNDYVASEASDRRALALQPNLFTEGFAFSFAHTHPEKAIAFFEKHLREDTLSAQDKGLFITGLTIALMQLRRFDEAEKWIALMRNENYGIVFLQAILQCEKGRIRLLQNRLAEAEEELPKACHIEPTCTSVSILPFALLGELKYREGKIAEAEAFYRKSISFPFQWNDNAFKNEAFFLYGRFLIRQNRPAEAQAQFGNALKISPRTWHYPMGMALLSAQKGRRKEALNWLEKALNRYYFDKWAIEEEPLFAKIRKAKRFKALMQTHFPEGWEKR